MRIVLVLWLTLWSVVVLWGTGEAAQRWEDPSVRWRGEASLFREGSSAAPSADSSASIVLPQDERVQDPATKGEALFVVEAAEVAGDDQESGTSSRGAASPLGVPILDQLLLWLGIEDLTSLPEFDVPMIPGAALVFNVHTEEVRRKDLVAPNSIDAYLRMTLREW